MKEVMSAGTSEPFRTLENDIAGLLGDHDDSVPIVATVPNEKDNEKEARVLAADARTAIRALVLTYDDVLSEGSPAQYAAAARGAYFDELHIIVPTSVRHPFTSLQLAKNVWVYPTNSSSWWRALIDAYQLAKQQLYFAGTFRADVIATDDPFELGAVGAVLAYRFKRALNVLVPVDPESRAYLDDDPNNQYRALVARFVLRRAARVRVPTEDIAHAVTKRVPRLAGSFDVTPRFIDVAAYNHATPPRSVREKYARFNFLMVAAGTILDARDAAFILDAVRLTLTQYPSVGLVMAVNGPGAGSLAKEVAAKGLLKSVVLEHYVSSDLATYIAIADLVLALGSSVDAEAVVTAAALGKPMIATKNETSESLIVDGESGLLCAVGDLGCAIKGINRYLNEPSFRITVSDQISRRITRVAGNAARHNEELRASLERAVLASAVVAEEGVDPSPAPVQ